MSDLQHTPYIPPRWAQSLRPVPHQRVRLHQTPTPLHRWNAPGCPDGCELWIKRDDRTGMALSGNKVRKLEFLLADALKQGCDCVLTCGGIQSNHCRTTSVAARTLGLDAYLFLRTDDPQAVEEPEGNLFLSQMIGATLVPISREQYRRRMELMEELAEELRAKGRRPYIIPEGGSDALGTWGYIEVVRELSAQIAHLGISFDEVILACGSGGTAAGFALGSALAHSPWRVRAINVCDDAAYFYNIVNRLYRELHAPVTAEDTLQIIDGYKGLGYSISHPDELALLRDVAQHTGILLDPTYTGKAYYGFVQEGQRDPERFQGKRVLFVHTGGLFGLYAKAEQLRDLLPSQPLLSWASGR